MRKKNQKQMPLMDRSIDHPRAYELQDISGILDENPIINEMVLQDLTRGVEHRETGAEGMSAEQVVRAAIIKQMEEFSYDDLAFHIVDSRCYRSFCRIGITHKGFGKSALCSNIKAILAETWEAVNRILVAYGEDKKIEKGRTVRMDCTVVSSNIHDPSDSSLLWDSVRVLTRMLGQINERFEGVKISFSDHTKRAKRRMLGVMNAKGEKTRKQQYQDLLKMTSKVVNYATSAVSALETFPFKHVCVWDSAQSMAENLREIIALTQKVIDQTTRRMIDGESVAACEKIVSIFEPHTDIIVKDRRDTFYGHKVCLSGGASNLIIDCLIVEGNPADSTLTHEMLDRQEEIYGRYPLKVALDGGFASKENLASAKGNGIKDVCFAKKRGLEVEEMCRSEYVYKRLRRFRRHIMDQKMFWIRPVYMENATLFQKLRLGINRLGEPSDVG
jgi:IS5 family transposase